MLKPISISFFSKSELDEAFGNANFGGVDRVELLKESVLKQLAGYRCGRTITDIMVELRLIGKKTRVPTKRGKRFLYFEFANKDEYSA